MYSYDLSILAFLGFFPPPAAVPAPAPGSGSVADAGPFNPASLIPPRVILRPAWACEAAVAGLVGAEALSAFVPGPGGWSAAVPPPGKREDWPPAAPPAVGPAFAAGSSAPCGA